MGDGGATRRITWRALIAAFIVVAALAALGARLYFYQTRAPDFADVAYAATSPSQKLDLYLPQGAGPHPVVVFIHGGAFKFGDKTGMGANFSHDVAAANAAGIALASINYRMSGEARFPAAVQDARAAVRFLRANAARYRLDPARIALWGQSAGGNIALMAGMSSGDVRFDLPGSRLNAVSDRVSAVVSMYGPTQFLRMDEQLKALGCPASMQNHNAADSPESLYLGGEIARIPEAVGASSPLTYVSPAMPPLLLQHGTADCIVPMLQSRILAERVKAVAGPGRATLEIREGADHADSAFDSTGNLAHVMAFLRRAFAARP